MRVARLRMFAGPNGSGKSTLKTLLPPHLHGTYLNADDIEEDLRQNGQLGLAPFEVSAPERELRACFEQSQRPGLEDAARDLQIYQNRLTIPRAAVNSYVAATLVEFLREKLLEKNASLSLETVMSHPSKVDLLRQARERGYRTYLYFVATEKPRINVSRVHNRVRQGGHSVPEEKIVSRYARSLALLPAAIAETNRAYVFDNSREHQKMTWIAEVTEGTMVELKTSEIPAWFDQTVKSADD